MDTTLDSHNASFDHIPITSHEVLINAWEVFELFQVRRTLHQAVQDMERSNASDVQVAGEAFLAFMSKVDAKVASYRKALRRAAERKGMQANDDIDDLVKFAKTLPFREHAVCHVAMLKVYLMVQTAYRIEQIMTPNRIELMRRLYERITDQCLSHYEIQLGHKKQAMAIYTLAGYDTSVWHLIANPLGTKTSGPRWELLRGIDNAPDIPPRTKTPTLH